MTAHRAVLLEYFLRTIYSKSTKWARNFSWSVTFAKSLGKPSVEDYIFILLTYDVPKWSDTLYNLAANAAWFLKCARPF